MAKKRQRKKVYKPPAPKLETQFNCPECGRKKVVEVRFIKRENKGYLRCRACGIEYETKLKKASAFIDVYYDWIDHREQEKENEYKNNKEVEDGQEYEEEEDNEEREYQENDEQSQVKENDIDNDYEEECSDY